MRALRFWVAGVLLVIATDCGTGSSSEGGGDASTSDAPDASGGDVAAGPASPDATTRDAGSDDASDAGTLLDSSLDAPADSGTDAGDASGGDAADAAPPADSGATCTGVETWTSIYDTIFGPNGSSSCAGASCHTKSLSGFACGTTAATCYSGFVNAGLVTPGANASSSPLVDPSQSCLCAVSPGGNMPIGYSCVTSAQLRELQCWLASGALDN